MIIFFLGSYLWINFGQQMTPTRALWRIDFYRHRFGGYYSTESFWWPVISEFRAPSSSWLLLPGVIAPFLKSIFHYRIRLDQLRGGRRSWFFFKSVFFIRMILPKSKDCLLHIVYEFEKSVRRGGWLSELRLVIQSLVVQSQLSPATWPDQLKVKLSVEKKQFFCD